MTALEVDLYSNAGWSLDLSRAVSYSIQVVPRMYTISGT